MATLLRRRLALDDELVVDALAELVNDWALADTECRLRVAIFIERFCSDLGDRPFEDTALRRRMTRWTGIA